MTNLLKSVRFGALLGALSGVLLLSACATTQTESRAELPQASGDAQYSTRYRIAPGDTVQIFVWRNPEVTTTVPVRPDGLLSAPLLEEVPAAGKTPAELARDLEAELATYLRDPLVTVIVNGFTGTFREQIRVVGEAAKPQALLYRDSMTMLDVMVQTGGLTQFADGNNATLVRAVDGKQEEYRVRLDDLLRDGDISANVDMHPGDVIIIPEAWF
ncbi:MAG: polysaccharide export protein [Gammaproteobacteria bacterium]|nr:polysaccharide export protein [Gammaproteobacteria bacterium]